MSDLMFGCLSRRVGLLLVASVYVVLGFMCLVEVMFLEVRGEKPGLSGWKHHSCQGSACGQMYQALSCNQTASWTLEINVLLMSMGAFYFGLQGVSGLVDRDASSLFLFYGFIATQYWVWVVSFIGDGLYVVVCGRLPESYWQILQDAVPSRLRFIETMGLEPRTLPPAILDELLHLHTVETILLVTGVWLLIFPYILTHCWNQYEWMGKGPTGLGSVFGLRIESEETKTFREVTDGLAAAINNMGEPPPAHLPISNLIRADRGEAAFCGRAAEFPDGAYGTFGSAKG